MNGLLTCLLLTFTLLAGYTPLLPANSQINETDVEALSPEQLEQWFNSDNPGPPAAEKIEDVNNGELTFIQPVKNKTVLHSVNTFTIDENSVENGWVHLEQCYRNLATVASAEVVYQYRFMQKLKILRVKNITKARVENQSVQLEDIKKNAELCVTAEVRNFYQNEDKTFSLINGPYHRKFFDGFFPYHLTLNIHFDKNLSYLYSAPAKQKNFSIKLYNNKLTVDTWFEGILNTEFRFVLNP